MATPQALVQALEGEVSVTRNGEVVNIKAGDYLLPGDVVETGADGRLSLEFPGIEGQTPVEGVMSANGRMSLGEQPGPLGDQIVVMEDGECFEFTSELTEESAAAEGSADGLAGLFGTELAGGGAALAGGGAIAAGMFSAGGGGGGSESSTQAQSGGGILDSGKTPEDVGGDIQTFTTKTAEDPSTAPQNAQEFVEVSQETIDALLGGAKKGTAPAAGGDDNGGDQAVGGIEFGGDGGNGGGGIIAGPTPVQDPNSPSGTGGGGNGGGSSPADPITEPGIIREAANAVADGIDENNGGQDSSQISDPIREAGGTIEDNFDSTVETVVDQLVSGPSQLDEATDFEGGAAAINEGLDALASNAPEGTPAELTDGLSGLQSLISEGAAELEAATDEAFAQMNLPDSGGESPVSAEGLVTALAQTVADITPSNTDSAELNTALDTVDGALVETGQAVDGLIGGLLGDASSLEGLRSGGGGSDGLETLTGGDTSGISSDAGAGPINLDDVTGGLG